MEKYVKKAILPFTLLAAVFALITSNVNEVKTNATASASGLTFTSFQDEYSLSKHLDSYPLTYELVFSLQKKVTSSEVLFSDKTTEGIMHNVNYRYVNAIEIKISNDTNGNHPCIGIYNQDKQTGHEYIFTEYTFSNFSSYNYHLAFTLTDTTISCYVEGNLKGEKENIDGCLPARQVNSFSIGGNICYDTTKSTKVNYEYFGSGTIYSLALFDSVIPSSSMSSHGGTLKSADFKGITGALACFRFDDASPTGNAYKDLLGSDLFISRYYFGSDAAHSDILDLGEYSYSFAIIPDPQWETANYNASCEYLTPIFDNIINNKEKYNTQYAFCVGDMTDTKTNTINEWKRFLAQTERLYEADIPYGLARGNHDNTTLFDQYYGDTSTCHYYQEYIERYGSVSNTYSLHLIEGVKWLMLNLDYGAGDDVLSWASNVIASYPDYNVIVNTHSLLYVDGDLSTNKAPVAPTQDGAWGARGNDGIDIWNKLLSKYSNIKLAICGHECSEDVLLHYYEGDNGNTVPILLTNQQYVSNNDRPFGSVVRLFFSKDGQTCKVRTWSSLQNQYYKAANQFSFDIDLMLEDYATKIYSEEELTVSDDSLIALDFDDQITPLDEGEAYVNKSIATSTQAHKLSIEKNLTSDLYGGIDFYKTTTYNGGEFDLIKLEVQALPTNGTMTNSFTYLLGDDVTCTYDELKNGVAWDFTNGCPPLNSSGAKQSYIEGSTFNNYDTLATVKSLQEDEQSDMLQFVGVGGKVFYGLPSSVLKQACDDGYKLAINVYYYIPNNPTDWHLILLSNGGTNQTIFNFGNLQFQNGGKGTVTDYGIEFQKVLKSDKFTPSSNYLYIEGGEEKNRAIRAIKYETLNKFIANGSKIKMDITYAGSHLSTWFIKLVAEEGTGEDIYLSNMLGENGVASINYSTDSNINKLHLEYAIPTSFQCQELVFYSTDLYPLYVGQLSIGFEKPFAIDFVSNSSEKVATQYIFNNEKVITPIAPSKEDDNLYHYTFAGWYLDQDCTKIYNFNKNVTSAFTLYAKWDKTSVAIYHLTIFINDYLDTSSNYNDIKNAYLALSADEQSLFYEDETYQTYYENLANQALINGDALINGKLLGPVSIKFNTNGGSEVLSQNVSIYHLIDKPIDPIKADDNLYHYTFAGWYTDENCTAVYDFSSQVLEEMTLYAKWDYTNINNYHIDSFISDYLNGQKDNYSLVKNAYNSLTNEEKLLLASDNNYAASYQQLASLVKQNKESLEGIEIIGKSTTNSANAVSSPILMVFSIISLVGIASLFVLFIFVLKELKKLNKKIK